MLENGVAKRRRCPPRRVKSKQIRYLELNSDEIVSPSLAPEAPHGSLSPEAAAQDDALPAASQGNNTPAPAQNNNNYYNNRSTPPEEPSSENPEAPLGSPRLGYHDLPTNFPPDIWDGLLSAHLTKRGLRELDRRNEALPRPVLKRPKRRPRSLAQWAMYGGPDTRHLRGYKSPEVRNLVRSGMKRVPKRHIRADPFSAGGRPEYHMTMLGTWDMKEGREMFANGASAFRNLLELAGGFRDHMVAEVNRTAKGVSGESSE